MVAAEEAFTHIKRMHDEHGLCYKIVFWTLWVTGMWCGLQGCGVGYRDVVWVTGMWCGLQGCGVGYRDVVWVTGMWCGLQGCGVGYRDVVLTN